ncbi:hypothetical protein BS78_01G040200 [Paspalum vaginatum]|nr:hypothetical protein BS78_01G040200 [Paspalum vaginatum]
MADGTNHQQMKKKKNREMLPPGVETTSAAWTGEKKAKFQSTPTSSDDLVMTTAARDATEKEGADDTIMDVIKHEQEQQGPEEIIEGFAWDEAVLNEKIKSYFKLRRYHGIPDYDDNEPWDFKDEQQLNDMNIRLAICRIKAHKYFERFEHDFEWYFHREYRNYAYFQDYQLLVLRDTAGEYMKWDIYHGAFSTLESDREFIQFWEKLSSKTEWIKNFLGVDLSERTRMESLAYYHALKIGQEFTNIFSTLLCSAFSAQYAFLYFDIWKLVAKQKMNFNEALFQVKGKGISPLCLHVVGAEIGIRDQMFFHGPVTSNYNTYVSNIDENLRDGEAYKLVMEAVKKFVT